MKVREIDWISIFRMTFCLGISTLLGFVTWLDLGARKSDVQFAFQMAPWPKAFLQHPTQVELVAYGNNGETQSRILYGYERHSVQWLHFVIDDLPPWTRRIQIIQLSPIDHPVLHNFRYTAYGQERRPLEFENIQTFGFLEVQNSGNGIFGRRDPAAQQTGVIISIPEPPAGYQAMELFRLDKSFAVVMMVAGLSFGFLFFIFELIRTVIRFAVEQEESNTKDISIILIQYMIPLIFGIVAAMSFALPFNAHADEFLHAATADFWKKYSLPVHGNNDLVLSTISYFGATYLNDLDLSYILAGKFSRLVELLFPVTTESTRIFNLSLGVTLLIVISIFNRRNFILVCILFFPQAWYLFSYYNNDAWGLFCGSMLVILSLSRNAPFHRLIKGDLHGREYWKTVALYACLLSCLVLSKKNYYVILIFSCILVAYQTAISLQKNGFTKISLIPLAATLPAWLAVLVTLLVAHCYHATFYNKEIMLPIQEQTAIVGFRPSDYAHKMIDKGLNIKSQGVSLQDMLFEKEWLKISIFSLFGQFGWIMFYASDIYYWFMLFLFTIAQVLILIIIMKKQSLTKRFFLSSVILIIFLNICLSAWHSWTRDFQPQARYLLSSFPIFLYLEYEARQHNKYFIRWCNYLAIITGLLGILCLLIIGVQIDKFVDTTFILQWKMDLSTGELSR